MPSFSAFAATPATGRAVDRTRSTRGSKPPDVDSTANSLKQKARLGTFDRSWWLMKGLKGDFSDINLASSLGCRSTIWCVPRNHLYLNVVQAFLYPFNQTREVVREAVAAMRVRSVKFWCRYSRPLLYVIKSLIINVHFGCGGWTLIDAVQAVWLNYAKLRLSLALRAIIVD